MKLVVVAIITYCLHSIVADFIFSDFNETTGLIFNKDAGTTSCFDDPLVISYLSVLLFSFVLYEYLSILCL